MDGDHGWMGECAFESGCLNASLSSMKKEAKSPSKNDENGEGFLKVLKRKSWEMIVCALDTQSEVMEPAKLALPGKL